MFDLEILLPNRPGALAELGEALGGAGISLEGGGVFGCGRSAHAHFLVRDAEAARRACESAGLQVSSIRPVLVRRLDQERPGQLGAIASALAVAGVNVETMYSDHENRLILVVNDLNRAERASTAWPP